jgi:methyl-accepting chemotaxis protein
MHMNKLKIATRLIISSLAFFLPVIVMLFFIISSYDSSIRFSRKEVYGNAYLRPLDRLLERIAAHMRVSHGRDDISDRARLVSDIDAVVADLLAVDGKYGAELLFTEEELSARGRSAAKASALAETWNQKLKGAGQDSRDAYFSFIDSIRAAVTQAGDASNLILDPDLDSYYMMDITLLALPQT